MDIPQPVLLSGLGGLSVQLLYLLDGLNASKDRKPDFGSFSYYFSIFCNIALSVILGYVYYDEEQMMNKAVYFHIGLSAPLILRTLATTIPEAVRMGEGKKDGSS